LLKLLRGMLAVLPVAAGCAHRPAGTFVWVNDVPSAALQDTPYVIGAGDLISVQVWNQERMSGRSRVRADGRVSLPLIGDVMVAGQTVERTARVVESKLEETKLVVAPRVTVTLEEPRQISVSVLGTVLRQGMYNLEPGAGMPEALAAAGGLTEFARKDRIFVVRRLPQPVRIRFRFDDITQASGRAAMFRILNGDVIVVE